MWRLSTTSERLIVYVPFLRYFDLLSFSQTRKLMVKKIQEKHGSFDQLDAILHQSQTLQKHTGAMGIAIVFALIGPVMNVIPLGLADPAITKDYVYDPNWLEWFRAAIRG